MMKGRALSILMSNLNNYQIKIIQGDSKIAK